MRYRNATFLFNLNKRRIFRKPTLNGLYTPFGSPVSGQKPSLPLKKGVLKSSRPSFLIKRAALGNLKASFHCTHWHRFFPLKKAPPLISVFSPQGRRGKPPSGAQNRYALRLADHQRSSPYFAGWDRLGITCYYLAKGTGYYSYFKTTLFCNKSQRERNVFYV